MPTHSHQLLQSTEVQGHLKWLMQMFLMKRDCFLIGPPTPLRRLIVQLLSNVLQLECEWAVLHQDVTDADLLLRREMRAGGTSVWVEQAAVRAATRGRLLVLDGVERCERNVLPVLNNLLENRELTLQDGRHVRASPDFWVVALGLPVPRYQGLTLDPPLRSRFQCRDVPHLTASELLYLLGGNMAPLIKFAQLVNDTDLLPEFTGDLLSAAQLVDRLDVLPVMYPHQLDAPQQLLYRQMVAQCNFSTIKLGGTISDQRLLENQQAAASALHQLLDANVPVCVIGPRSCGKSYLVDQMDAVTVFVYKDQSVRDFYQLRVTTDDGATAWRNSALVQAAISGKVAVLDGVEQLSAATLASLQRLFSTRLAQLPDGSRVQCHQNFRVVALARDSIKLTAEVVATFAWIRVPCITLRDELKLVDNFGGQLRQFVQVVRQSSGMDSVNACLSTRQLLRISRKRAPLHDQLTNACLYDFLPVKERALLANVLQECGITSTREVFDVSIDTRNVSIGDLTMPIKDTEYLHLVPDIEYYENAAQTIIMHGMLMDYKLGNAVLLIGNQGTGKNKIADRFCQLLQLPRQYMQLHRDSTVQSLVSVPSLAGGMIVYQDSPLVLAATRGHVLVIDEADKAPAHVLVVLKSLLQNQRLDIGDGRVLGVHLPIHADFRIIVLANRPGYPFLGNDFQQELGDCFSPYPVPVPDAESEMALLTKFAPDTDVQVLTVLQQCFTDLRQMVDDGQLSYPYSTRELVNIARHLQRYPKDSVSLVIANVFDFDRYDTVHARVIRQVFERRGVSFGAPIQFESIIIGRLVTQVTLGERETWPIISQRAIYCQDSQFPVSNSKKMVADRVRYDLSLQVPPVSHVSELVCQFRLPGAPTITAASNFKDGTLVLLKQHPTSIILVDADMRGAVEIDVHETFSADAQMTCIDVGGQFARCVCMLNTIDGRLYLYNFDRDLISTMTLAFNGGEASQSVIVTELAATGILVAFIKSSGKVIVLNFATGRRTIIDLNMTLNALFMIDSKLLLVQTRDLQMLVVHFDASEAHVSSLHQNVPVAMTFANSSHLVTNHQVYYVTKHDYGGLQLIKLALPVLSMRHCISQTSKFLVSHDRRQLQVLADVTLLQLELADGICCGNHIDNGKIAVVDQRGRVAVLDVSLDSLTKRKQLASMLVGDANVEATHKLHGFGAGGFGQADGPQNSEAGMPGNSERNDFQLSARHFEDRKHAEQMSVELRQASQDIRRQALGEKLSQLEFREADYAKYQSMLTKIEPFALELHAVFESAQIKTMERQWVKNQTTGEFDDAKLIDGFAGERNTYKRRDILPPLPGSISALPKSLLFGFDVSASMARYNAYDQRLERSLEVVLMLMTSLAGMDSRFKYAISGHSGDTSHLPFVPYAKPPTDDAARYCILQKMNAHAAHTISGDSTLQALRQLIAKSKDYQDVDQRLVILVSDANIDLYGITTAELKQALTSEPTVKAVIVFIGSLRDQAQVLQRELPASHCYVCMNTAELPKVIKLILL